MYVHVLPRKKIRRALKCVTIKRGFLCTKVPKKDIFRSISALFKAAIFIGQERHVPHDLVLLREESMVQRSNRRRFSADGLQG